MTSLKIFTDTADQERLTDELTSSSILARAVAVERMSGVMKYPILQPSEQGLYSFEFKILVHVE